MASDLVNGGDPTAGEEFPTGPDIGDVIPAFTLPDQSGNPVTHSPDSGKAYILFHRSASW